MNHRVKCLFGDINAVDRTMDLSILGFQNAGERSLDEWVALFQEANPGFNLTMAKQPLGSGHGFIEMTWKDK